MDENKSLNYVLVLMANLNLIIILYISVFMAYSLSGYIRANSAHGFLLEIDKAPIAAWKIPTISLCLYLVILLLMRMHNISNAGLIVKVALELGISFFGSYILGFAYTGILLFILADTMKWFPKSKWKFTFAVVICMFYLLMDFNLLVTYFDVVPLEKYLEYFQNDMRSMLLGIINIMSSLNTFIFLVYMILLVRMQMSEKDKIMVLNEQLNFTNAELQEANRQLEEYAKESVRMTETKERNRLAREIHDTLGHALTGIITGIEACTALMDVAPEATKVQLNAIAEVARQGVTDVRRSVKALRPDALEKLDLQKAILQIVASLIRFPAILYIFRCKSDTQ